MTTRPTLDVAHLPGFAFDSKAPVWWGNLLMVTIETTTVAMLLLMYFYVWSLSKEWPPTKSEAIVPIVEPVPELHWGTANLVILLASCIPMYLVDRAARDGRERTTWMGLFGMTTIGCIAIALRFLEFQTVQFRWDDNTYGSLVWAFLFLHLIYLISEAIEVGLMGLWIALHGMDERHQVDVTLTGGYWYWVVGIWVPIYLTVYWAPRWL
jgi:heme/copper-type cytochrome/quinol oxidase subunit 3